VINHSNLFNFIKNYLTVAVQRRSAFRAPKIMAEPLLSHDVESSSSSNAKFTFTLFATTVFSALGSAQFGWNLGVLNSPQLVMEQALGLAHNSIEWSIIIAAFSISGCIGALFSSTPIDRFGRKTSLVILNAFFILGGTLGYLASVNFNGNFNVKISYGLLFASRLILGLGAGAASSGVPLYLGEIAPAHLKGAYGALSQFHIVLYILLSQVVGFFMSTSTLWGPMLSISGMLGLVALAASPLMIESPRWLLIRGKKEAALKALVALRGYSMEDAESEVIEMMPNVSLSSMKLLEEDADLDLAASSKTMSIMSVLSNPIYRQATLTAVFLQVSQQLSGINAVIFFSTGFFTDANIKNATLGTLVVGVVNLLATMVSVVIMDKVGRKVLLLIGSMGTMLAAVGLTICLVAKSNNPNLSDTLGLIAVALVMVFIACFAVGLGAIPWQIAGEMLPEKPRAVAMGLSAAINWTFTTIIALAFLPLSNALGNFSFLPFAGFLFITTIFTIFFVPETRGKTPTEVLKFFNKGYAPIKEETESEEVDESA
jgi:sugar porter (SP) family MFS transporter